MPLPGQSADDLARGGGIWRARRRIPAFSPKTADDGDATGWAKKTEQRLQKAVEAIAGVQTWQREQDQERAQELVNRQTSIAAARALAESGTGMLMTRIHGDFHFGPGSGRQRAV